MKTNSDTLFSFYKSPITNTKPNRAATILQIYDLIRGNAYKDKTDHLRTLIDPQQARQYKVSNFDYVTFSGVFTSRKDCELVKHSGLLCLDFDHLINLETIRTALLSDEYFETQLLFTSPSGNGIKWLISIDTDTVTHGDYFTALSYYIKKKYAIEPDKSGRDISRACFLPNDPTAYINPNNY
ncbi:VirE protein [Bacteroidia bacterium]|nr:VirE protein [Bacteroidia bacterium]